MPTQFQTLCRDLSLYDAWKIVKAKGSAGGIDGQTLDDFERVKRKEIPLLVHQLQTHEWKPQPYLQIAVPKTKDPNEVRRLGMATVRDKIVQQAIRALVEPRIERVLWPCCYAYRPGRNAVKAIRRLVAEYDSSKYSHVLRLDIDNYFDCINHDILQQRLTAIGVDIELIRLIMLCVRMGKVDEQTGRWIESDKGVPQGGILSPSLSNLYLLSFDQFASSKGVPFIRYADDFVYYCTDELQAQSLCAATETYLANKLQLKLNEPYDIHPLSVGFDFLGVHIQGREVGITPQKGEELRARIGKFILTPDGLNRTSQKAWEGFRQYYAKLLPQDKLEILDKTLRDHFEQIVRNHHDQFKRRSDLKFALSTIQFLSKSFAAQHNGIATELLELYSTYNTAEERKVGEEENRRIIQQRKEEYRRRESELTTLLVNKPGSFIGLTSRGITVSHKGQTLTQQHAESVSQIVVTSNGVAFSSNLLGYCASHGIPVDLFDGHGSHLGSFLSTRSLGLQQWRKQALADDKTRNTLAMAIIDGKIRNQYGLLKYFHKYHKLKAEGSALAQRLEDMKAVYEDFRAFKLRAPLSAPDYVQQLVTHEAKVAIRYWSYIRQMLLDDGIDFPHREHRGATDLFNSLLNYGYAILYARVWQSLLAAHLNPYESLIHAQREGKPTLVYDMVEIFRSQVVDRVVISLIQKGISLQISGGWLSDETRGILAKAVMERLARYSRFQNQEMRMKDIIRSQCRMLAQAFEGTSKFKPYIAKW